jgi:hypothetical protein
MERTMTMSTEDVSASADTETDDKVFEEGKNLGIANNYFLGLANYFSGRLNQGFLWV